MANDAGTVEAILKKDYEQDHVFLVIIILLIQIGLIVALGGFIFYQIKAVPKPIYFLATEREQIIKPVPLQQAGMNEAAILNWSVEAIRVAYSFNYRSINNHVSKLSPYFDQRGLTKFFQVTATDINMKQVQIDKLIVSVKAKEAPKIIKEGEIENRYAWLINLPVEVRYENAAILRRQEMDIELYVWRVPETESPIGIKITNFRTIIKHVFQPQGFRTK